MSDPRRSAPRGSTPPPQSATLDSTTRDMLRGAFLHELTHSERLLLLLRYAEQMTVAETAVLLNMTHDDVVAAQERLVGRLREHVRAA